ncbi:MAG TPA: hypothetical protein VMB48_00630 [Steroidobacteraceae bacterium]|nr:hypothetical protein [Steroidobacteraceae bacterium]
MSNANPPAVAGRTPPWEARSWLRPGTLQSLVELNEQCLELLRQQACAGAQQPLLRDLRTLWRELEPGSRRRAAGMAVLLLDAGFSDAARWAMEDGVRDQALAEPAPFFTVSAAVPVMRQVLVYAWHLAHAEGAAARLLLGMSADCVDQIGSCTLSRVTRLAETRTHWLRPRWAHCPVVWRDLLTAALAGEARALQRMRLRGLSLLAAEVCNGREAR